MQLFYEPSLLDGATQLGGEEAHHCLQVLRKSVGDQIHLVDGLGGLYTAQITAIHGRKRCEFDIIDKKEDHGKPAYDLHLAIAPTKNISRIEWLLEKATELGISEISPFISKHSERKVIKEERLKKILVGAMKQSLRASLPVLNPLRSFKDFISSVEGSASEKYIAHLHPEHQHLSKIYRGGPSIMVIGPEGDFSQDEIEAAKAAGFTGVSLGDSRLRTETAGLLVCSLCNLHHVR